MGWENIEFEFEKHDDGGSHSGNAKRMFEIRVTHRALSHKGVERKRSAGRQAVGWENARIENTREGGCICRRTTRTWRITGFWVRSCDEVDDDKLHPVCGPLSLGHTLRDNLSCPALVEHRWNLNPLCSQHAQIAA